MKVKVRLVRPKIRVRLRPTFDIFEHSLQPGKWYIAKHTILWPHPPKKGYYLLTKKQAQRKLEEVHKKEGVR